MINIVFIILITAVFHTGWEAKIPRAEGMKITYEYFKNLPREALLKEAHKDFSGFIH